MERIIEHIECLLLQHDCVIIPDFGGFVLQTIPAEYLEESHLFTPSHKEIVFNPTLTHNDGLLSESYMQRYSMDFAKAQSIVRNDVAEMKGELDDYAELQLGSIGLFFKEEERLIFMPAKQSDELFNVQSYGLPVFNLLPLSARDAFDLSSLLKTEPKKKVEAEKVLNRRKNIIYSIPVTRTFIRIVAASAAVILLFLFLATPINDVNKASYSASFMPHEIMPKKTVEEISIGAFMNNDEMDTANLSNNERDDTTDYLASVSTTTTPATDNTLYVDFLSGSNTGEKTTTDINSTTISSPTPTMSSPDTTSLSPTPAMSSPDTTSLSPTLTLSSHDTTSSSTTGSTVTENSATTTATRSSKSATASSASSASPRISKPNSRLSSSSAKTGGMKYYVIIASYKSTAKAQAHINGLKGIDKTHIGILVRDGHARVYAQIFSSQQEAQSYQKKINLESWIYIVQ